ncbi:phostensin-like isoform X2 [Carcharodon carcharias]|uniref:phostensin-like isoform X2 n=1 Tax=Carcharodon carcharias TaxID=13397 RepID=UPI001B7F58BE|nr:phostensin-like isoform X2 [Carcharodon carcharias]
MAALPQWKVQLLERKRRDEEEGRRKEQEELERLARMPAWKREIIERRRARLCSGSSQSESPAEAQARPSVQAGPGGSAEAEGMERPSGLEPEACDAKAQEDAVLRENIGPLHQNHFIQREKQRKEAPELEQAPRGRQLAELFNQVTGAKTIRVDNITIVESVPARLDSQGEQEALNGLSSKPGANQLHIKSSLSRSVEDLNTFERGREEEEDEEEEGEEEEEEVAATSGRGRVSRLLFKFGQRGGAGAHPRPTRSRSTENIIERPSHSGTRSRSSGVTAPRLGRRPLDRSPSPAPVATRRCSASAEEGPCPALPHTVAAFRSRFEARFAEAGVPGAKRADSPHRPAEGGQPDQRTAGLPVEDAAGPGRGTPEARDQAAPRRHQDRGEAGHAADRLPAVPAAEPARAGPQERQVANTEDTPAGEQPPRADPSQKWRPPAPASLDDAVETKPVPAEARAATEPRAHPKKSFATIPRCRQDAPPEQEVEALVSSGPGNSAASSISVPKPQPVSTASSSCGEQASVCFTVAAAAAAASCLSAAPDQRGTDNGSRDQEAELGPERPLLPEFRQEPPAAGEEAEGEPSMSRLYGVKPPSVGPARAPAASPEEVRLPAYSVRASGSLFSRSEGAGQATPTPSNSEPLAQQSSPETEASDGQVWKATWAQAGSREGPSAGSESPPATTTRAGRPGPQRKSGKTITINPRKMAANKTLPTSAVTAENGVAPSAGTQPTAVPGAPTKKRYPTVEEIQVIGGYLSLQRSCLVKTGGSRGKLKISFNDCELESTFEYPSELTLLAELGPDKDEEPAQAREPDEEEEVEEKVLVRRLGVDKTSTVSTAIRRKPLIVDESCR